MSLTFAVADLHGRYDLLEAAIAAIEDRADSGTVVFTGDYIDRGFQSRQIIERLMAGPTKPGWTWRRLRGNHEDIMLICCAQPLKVNSWWIPNGGGRTLISYGHPAQGKLDLSVIPPEHLEWMASLPRLYVDKHRVFVHAGVDPDLPLDQQDEHEMGWMLYPAGADGGHADRHVVHGHEQFADGPKFYKHRTDLDTFAWFTGRLVVGVFDDDKAGGPIDLIEVRGPTIQELKAASA